MKTKNFCIRNKVRDNNLDNKNWLVIEKVKF